MLLLILGQLHPLFEHLPVENMVYSNQEAYYDAIGESTECGQSGPFIDFMLGEILVTLKSHQGADLSSEVPSKVPSKSEILVLDLLREDGAYTRSQLAERTGLSDSGVKKILASLKAAGCIVREGSDKNGRWLVLR